MGDLIGGIFGQGTPSAPDVQVFQPKNVNAADQLYYNTLSQQTQNNPFAQNAPAYQNLYNAQNNNPYRAGAQQSANNAGQAFQQQGTANSALAPYLVGAAARGVDYGNQVYQQGQDPQGALYGRTVQQLQDQVRTSQAARGIVGSGYGADLENEALSNFNIDWQNQQLQRALAGLSGYSGALQTAGGVGQQAYNIGQGGAQQLQQAGQVPYGQYNANLADRSAALNQYVGSQAAGQGLQQANLSQLLSYLGLGANQSNAQGNFTLQNYQNKLAEAQASQQGIANLANAVIGGVGGFAGGIPGGGGGSSFIPTGR